MYKPFPSTLIANFRAQFVSGRPKYVFGYIGATPDDLREAVTTLEETARTARRVLGGTHPLTSAIEGDLRESRAALREAPRS